MKPQYPSTQNNETMMKCRVRKSVIFSSNVLVTFHSHVSVETVVIPYPPRAEHWNLEDLSPASRSAKPRCATPCDRKRCPVCVLPRGEAEGALAASVSRPLPISRCARDFPGLQPEVPARSQAVFCLLPSLPHYQTELTEGLHLLIRWFGFPRTLHLNHLQWGLLPGASPAQPACAMPRLPARSARSSARPKAQQWKILEATAAAQIRD